MLSARLCKGKLPLQRLVCVFMNAVCSQHWQLQRQMFANVQEWFSVHLNKNNLFRTSSISRLLWQEEGTHPPFSSSSVFFLRILPIKKQTESQINPIPLQCSHPHPGLCQVGEIIGIVYPQHTHYPRQYHHHSVHTYLPSSSPFPAPSPPSSSPFLFFSSTKWDARVWSPEPICRPMWHPSLQTWALCLSLPGKEARNYFYPPNTWICTNDFKCLPRTLSGLILAMCQTHYIDLSFSVFQ